MIDPAQSLYMKRFMTAAANLLTGPRGDPGGPDFHAGMILIVGGTLGMTGMLYIASIARLNRKNVVHVTPPNAERTSLEFTLAVCRGEQVTVHENCVIWLRNDRDPVHLIPDDFKEGSYQLAPNMKLKARKCPARDVAAAELGIRRAHRRLANLAVSDAACAEQAAQDWTPIHVTLA